MSEQIFVLISSFFSSSSSFRTLHKIRHKTRIHARIELKFGTLKGLIKADLRTNVGRNPMNIQGVMTNYLLKIRSKVCHEILVSRHTVVCLDTRISWVCQCAQVQYVEYC